MSEKQNLTIDMELSGQDGEAREYTRKSDSSRESRHSNPPSESFKRLTSPESQESSQDGQVVLYNSTKEMVRFLPFEQGKVVEENAEAISNQVGETKVLGKKASRWGWLKSKILAPGAAGAVAGFFAKAGLHSAVKAGVRSAAEFGAAGTGAIAGGVVGGVWAGFKEYRSEGRRLQELQTYTDSLKDMQKLSDLEKIEKFVSIQKALVENKVGKDVQESLAQTEQMRELSAFVNSEKWTKLEGAEKFTKILELRKAAGIEQIDSLGKKPANFWEKAEAHEKAKSEAEAIKKFQKEAQEILKDKGLSKNRKKIAFAALRGATVGAVGGALGAAAFDLLADKLGFAIKEGATQAYESTKVTRDIIREKTVDSVTLKGNVWNTIKQWYLDHGVKPEKISNHLINEGMKIASEANQVEITAHHGLGHAHFDAIKDVRMEKGFQLHHMEKLNDLIKQAGGQIETEVITETRFIPSPVPETESKVPTEKIMDYVWGFGKKVIPTAILGGAGYGYYRHRKGKKQAGANAVQSEAKPSNVNEADGVYKVSKKFRMPSVGTYETEQAEAQRFEQSKAKDVFHMPGESWEPKLIAEAEANENKLTQEIIEEVSGKITEIEKRDFSVMSHAELQAVNTELSGVLDKFEVVENAVKSGQHPELAETVGLFHGVIESIVAKMEKRLGEIKDELRGVVDGNGSERSKENWKEYLEQNLPRINLQMKEIETAFDLENQPMEAWKRKYYLDSVHKIASPVVKIYHTLKGTELHEFNVATGETNDIYWRLINKVEGAEVLEAVDLREESDLDSHNVQEAVSARSTENKESNWKQELGEIITETKLNMQNIEQSLGALEEVSDESWEKLHSDFVKLSKPFLKFLKKQEVGTQREVLIEAQDFIESLKVLEKKILNSKPKNGEAGVSEAVASEVASENLKNNNQERPTEVQDQFLKEAIDLGIFDQVQVDKGEHKRKLDKYIALFQDGGLIEQAYIKKAQKRKLNIKEALKEGLQDRYPTKLINIFRDLRKQKDTNPQISHLMDELRILGGSMGDLAYKVQEADVES